MQQQCTLIPWQIWDFPVFKAVLPALMSRSCQISEEFVIIFNLLTTLEYVLYPCHTSYLFSGDEVALLHQTMSCTSKQDFTNPSNSFISSENIFTGLSQKNNIQLQLIQNSATRMLVTLKTRSVLFVFSFSLCAFRVSFMFLVLVQSTMNCLVIARCLPFL